MRELRSGSKKMKEEEIDIKKVQQNEISQWIILTPEHFEENDSKICKLPHPQNGVSTLFAFQKNKVFEFTKHKESYSSWFIRETVQKDGSVHMITPIDPLFLVIPYFIKAAEQGQHTTLDNILYDTDHAKAMQSLEASITKKSLMKICTVKGDDDYTAYKICEEKLLKWLAKKVEKLSLHLQKADINTSSGGQSATFIRNSAGNKNKDDCTRYAWTIISDYIQPSWSIKLKDHLNIKEPVKEQKKNKVSDQPPAKRQKTEGENKCVEDYRDHTSLNKTKKPVAKLTSKQKSLLKVDKKGMKAMSSFFTKTPKK